jgi:iron-sulfur cluster repair protein YtfE (RIC family)
MSSRSQEARTLTQPLRDEHKELLVRFESLRTVADSAGDVSSEEVRRGVDEVDEFLTQHLIPHAQAEEGALYPVVARIMGAPQATATMSRDHVEVGRLTEELKLLRPRLSGAAIGSAEAKGLRRVLYGLYALVKVHFAKEEEVYLPILDAHLGPQEAHRMFEAMEEAAKAAKSRR